MYITLTLSCRITVGYLKFHFLKILKFSSKIIEKKIETKERNEKAFVLLQWQKKGIAE